jgi:hypothetical protein
MRGRTNKDFFKRRSVRALPIKLAIQPKESFQSPVNKRDIVVSNAFAIFRSL